MIVVVAVMGGVAAARARRDPVGVDAARRIVADADRFGNGPESAKAFYNASQALQRAARACVADRAEVDGWCSVLYSAAASAQAAAVALYECTMPGVHRAREEWRGYLERLAAFGRDPSRPLPPLPGHPDC